MMDLNELFRAVGRIEAGQDAMKKDIADIKEGVSDYRRLKNKLIGACAIVSALAGAAWNYILEKVHGV